jgi:hypothetical protein
MIKEAIGKESETRCKPGVMTAAFDGLVSEGMDVPLFFAV